MADINNKHTPGPWEWLPSTEYGFSALWNPETRDEVLVPGGKNDGDCPITWMGEELSDANARLISAAPDMLEALYFAVGAAMGQHADPRATLRDIQSQLSAVIAKATGKAP